MGKIGVYGQGFLVGELEMKDTSGFGSDSSWNIQFKFAAAGRKSVKVKISKAFVNTRTC